MKDKTSPKVILVFGPTAIGKTEFLVRNMSNLAEVVNADSMQIYRGLDIGTSKPSPEVRAIMKHHLLDVVEYMENFSVGDFVRLAEDALAVIRRNDRIPIISGGAAFYIKSWLMGLPSTPVPYAGLRNALIKKWADKDNHELHAELARVDGESAKRISVSDRYRILRAMEIFQQSGQRLSEFQMPQEEREDYQILQIGLTMDRDVLYRRIKQRVEQMMHKGLEREIDELKKCGAAINHPGMRGIG